jgi:hypothetical protein
MLFFMVCFSYINAWKTYHKKLHAQMVFLMLNTWFSKHVEDTKNWINTSIWKSVHFVGLHYIIVTVQFALLSYINCDQLHMHLVPASSHTNCNQHSTSEEQSPHASSHSLPVIQMLNFFTKWLISLQPLVMVSKYVMRPTSLHCCKQNTKL